MGKKIRCIVQQEQAAPLVGTVTIVSSLSHMVRQPIICNYTDGYVQIILDGVNFMILGPSMATVLDITSNALQNMHSEDGPLLAKGSIIQLKNDTTLTAPTSGKVVFSGLYEQGE